MTRRMVAVIALVIGMILGGGVWWYVLEQRWYDRALWVNYEVDQNHMVTWIRLDDPSIRAKGLFIQLPPSCSLGTDIDNWQPGTWGRFAFAEGKCKVQRYRNWGREETAAHFRELEAAYRER